jgi:hypothetical protein
MPVPSPREKRYGCTHPSVSHWCTTFPSRSPDDRQRGTAVPWYHPHQPIWQDHGLSGQRTAGSAVDASGLGRRRCRRLRRHSPGLASSSCTRDGTARLGRAHQAERGGVPRPHVRAKERPLARAGSPFAGRALHPLDDAQSFMKASPRIFSKRCGAARMCPRMPPS